MDTSNNEFSFEEEENNIRLPDEVKRDTLIEDTRSPFQKETDMAIYQSMIEHEDYANSMAAFETRIMYESSLETENRKKQFAGLLHDIDKVSRFDPQIKEIYNIIEPIIESYCFQFIHNYEFDKITHDKIFTTLYSIRTNKQDIELLKTVIIMG
jgi:HD superfamily phosphohydrolase YqeK